MDVVDGEDVPEPEVDPVLAVPRGERIEPDFERVHAPVIQDGIHDIPPALAAELQPRRPFRPVVETGIGNHLAELRAAEIVRGFPVRVSGRRLDGVLQLHPG